MQIINTLKKWLSSTPIEIELEGKWTGFYTYSLASPKLLRNPKFRFDMELMLNDDNFEGFVSEEIIGGEIEDQIVVYGKFVDQKIEFHKLFRYSYQLDEQGKVSKIEGITSPVLTKYVGHYYQDMNKFIGQWTTRYEYENKEYSSSGMWEMEPNTHN
ncbi:hypothetical protein [Flammeovirga sp. EKP202]|uniref:hypothetical protein n=1 Tax=Flammeovirga sp. EKP202 TaxID=2770592 RepID=UPI00165EDEF9|nr:hypothetical protein [Flammeovirga sp. EKP202]MBD0404973.1 hypothetical protein [Flammeovirga sp. EKP202]